MKYLSLFSLMAMLLFVPACGDDEGNDPTPSCDTENITYSNFVGDVLNESCAFSAGCHFAGNPAIGGLTTYAEASNFAFESTMIAALRRDDANVEFMPRDTTTGMATADPLPDCTIDKIEAWLDAGKPE